MPKSVRIFELCWLASLVVGIIAGAVSFGGPAARPAIGFTLVVQGTVLFFMMALVLLVSRRKSAIARRVLIGLFLVGIVFYIPQLARLLEAGVLGFIPWVQFLLQGTGLYFLFKADARDWFGATG